MSDSTTPPYRQGAAGSISGFDPIVQADDSTLAEANFSIAQLQAFLQTFDALYAPARIRQVEQTILAHVRNFNNPHQDNIGQLSSNLVSSLLLQYAPGTIPLCFPVSAVEAALEELDTILSSITVVRTGEINVIDRQGFLSYVGPNTSGVDWSHGYPVLPCWPAKTQLFSSIDLYTPNSAGMFVPLNTVVKEESQNGIVPVIMNQQTTFYETAVQSQFGFTHTLPNVIAGAEYTFSVFVYPRYTRGSLVYRTTTGDIGAIRLSDGGVLSTPGIIPYVYQLPNGWWRIGFQFVVGTNNLGTMNQMLFCQTEFTTLATLQASSLAYIGTATTPIFVAYGPQLTTGPGVAPFTQSGTITATTISSPGFDAATLTNSGMIAVRYVTASSLLAGQNESLITISNDLNVTMGDGNLSSTLLIGTPPVVTTATYQNDTLNTYAISYDKTGVSMQCTGNDKTTVSSQGRNFTSLATMETINFGSFCGGLCAAEFYSVSDDSAALSFLVGEP